ncbi:AAA family ATPase [Aquibium sp. ELW1220]|uniref:AAA family ATPase n=1 Tax=Aquibium sp. ELW1220 TaxID=2976766 RepID=UPI0025AEE0FA|nr:AAA family ATPase [Aquibium sp. ELW1220]MDN2579194.1 AAA family ATPase [Aquibium sp. ELW1220]
MIDVEYEPLEAVIARQERNNAAGSTLPVISAASFDGKPVPVRDWHVDGLIPAKTVTLLGGDGGTGKSLLALQLAAATVTGGYWAGREAAKGNCLYLSAEDDVDELHRRLADIADHERTSLANLSALAILPLAGRDALLAAPEGKAGQMKRTPLMADLDAYMAERHADLIVIDTLADVYGGDENVRAQARQFVGMLRSFCTRYGSTVLLLAHPSLSGMSSGSGLSGSTAWNNSVRSRLYFERVKSGDGSEDDPDLRVLKSMKSNYGRTGEEIRLRWQAGVFKPATSESSFSAMASESKADRIFLDLLAAYECEGRPVTSTTGHGYAPALFAKDGRAGGVSKASLINAMNRMFEAGKIRNVEVGPPSRRTRKIVAA